VVVVLGEPPYQPSRQIHEPDFATGGICRFLVHDHDQRSSGIEVARFSRHASERSKAAKHHEQK
jgi:hypothetical protein